MTQNTQTGWRIKLSHPGHHRQPIARTTNIKRKRQIIFRGFPFAYTPSYPDREHSEPAPVYPAQTLEQMQRRLAALADIAVRDEIEREHSNANIKDRRGRRLTKLHGYG